MLAEQREPGQVVVEEDVVWPGVLVMAILACRALCSAVRVVVFMAVTT